jgi:hypothetical protein
LLELLLLTVLAASGAAAVPLAAGEFAWSWDALNHHIYLGLTAEQSRWDLDVIPASSQTYQYPYLYWPVYRLSLLNLSGATVGALWAGGQATLILPPVWWISWRLLPAIGSAMPAWLERSLACALAFMSLVVLSSLQTTASDLLAAVPLLWALALWVHPERGEWRCAGAAALLGCAMAFKLSNALFLPLILVWLWAPDEDLRTVWRRALAMGLGVSLGFGLAYGPWGWQLWQHTGNPFHPFFAAYFGRG